MIARMAPGRSMPTAGMQTCASTFPTATGMPGRRPVRRRRFGRQAARRRPQGQDIPGEFFVHQVGQARIERGEKLLGRESRPLVPGFLIARRAGVARFPAAQLPDDPIRRLDKAVGGLIDFLVLLQHLPHFRNRPFGGNFAAVIGEPGLPPFPCDGVEAVGVALGRVVLPELGIGMGSVPIIRKEAERRTVGQNRQNRAGCKIGADAHHVLRIHSGLPQNSGDGGFQNLEPVLRMLERPIVPERRAVGKSRVHDAMRIFVDRARQFFSGIDIHQHRPSGQGAVIHAESIRRHRIILSHSLIAGQPFFRQAVSVRRRPPVEAGPAVKRRTGQR